MFRSTVLYYLAVCNVTASASLCFHLFAWNNSASNETIFKEFDTDLFFENLLTVYRHTVHDTHALQVTICSHSTDDALHIFYADTVNQMCNF